MDIYTVISSLSNAIERVADKVQELNPGADMSGVRSDLEEALDGARQLDDDIDTSLTPSSKEGER